MFNKEQNPEECDATGFNSSSVVWFIIKICYLNTIPLITKQT